MGDASDSRELLPALAALPGHLFWRAQARVSSALAETLPPGVDIHSYAALLALAGGATRSQQALAETISISRTTMVKVAADLAAQGLVERVRNPDDRRSYALTRTAEGAAAAVAGAGTPRTSRRRSPRASPWPSARSCARCCSSWPSPTSPPTPRSRCARASASWSPGCTRGCTASSWRPRAAGHRAAPLRHPGRAPDWARSRRPSWPAAWG